MNGKLFIGNIHVQNRNIVGDSVRKLAYDIPDSRVINRKIFCKSGPRAGKNRQQQRRSAGLQLDRCSG